MPYRRAWVPGRRRAAGALLSVLVLAVLVAGCSGRGRGPAPGPSAAGAHGSGAVLPPPAEPSRTVESTAAGDAVGWAGRATAASPWTTAAEGFTGDLLTGAMGAAFQAAAAESGTPAAVLVAVGYAQSRLNHHGGLPSAAGGYGVMHLLSHPGGGPLEQAARLLGLPPSQLIASPEANIRGAAALLAAAARDAHGQLPADLADWYPAVAALPGGGDWVARDFADQVYQLLNDGLDLTLPTGEHIHLEPRAVTPNRGPLESVEPTGGPDYSFAHWVPAHPGNIDPHDRPGDGNPIEYIVIHVGQGSYNSIIRWFQNPASEVSAHYVVRSYDGQVTQMVHERDVAWHAGNSHVNHRSIGIEHEGWVSDCAWFTDPMYRSTAQLVRYLAEKYAIPRTRERIIGHNEVPGATHTDPGPCWDWDYFMSLVSDSVSVLVDDGTPGRFHAGGNWGFSAWNAQRFGDAYRFTVGRPDQDSAFYKIPVPLDGDYDLYAWFPGHPLYNGRTRVVVWQADEEGPGLRAVPAYLDQREGGGWVLVGRFPLRAGDDWIVQITRATDSPGYIIADAVMIVLQNPR